MRIHAVNLLIAAAISALVGYGFWAVAGDLRNYLAVGSFAYLFGTLGPAMGIVYERPRSATNLRVVCAIFVVLGLSLNGGFALFAGNPTAYVLSSAISFLVYLFLAHAIYNARQ